MRRWQRIVLGAGSAIAILALGGTLYVAQQLRGSLPRLAGGMVAPGLAKPVRIERDAAGVPTITAASRTDLAWGLGFLHGQERFFAMDTNRRLAAGELSGLIGPSVRPVDRRYRLHRFRARAEAIVAALSAEERALVQAYTDGVNRGLGSLGASPYPYLLLRSKPVAWQPADTVLTVFAMYFSLQDSDGAAEKRRSETVAALGPAWTDFLYPRGTDQDAALDGSTLPEPPLPADLPELLRSKARASAPPIAPDQPVPGSNGWAVDGTLTADGRAMVANDMHLGLRVPNIWYRARMIVADPDQPLDLTGVTLPGAPTLVAGSNRHIAWGFTNSYVDTGDLVVVEPAEAGRYRTPDGSEPFRTVAEKLCTGADCETLSVEETRWGPVVDTDAAGRKLAFRWVAHDPKAVSIAGFLAMERAGSVAEAVDVAHRMGMPNQNLVVADGAGAIGWTVTGLVPRRFGAAGPLPASWADGSSGWDGWRAPAEIPTLLGQHRIWTANQRIVGGDALATLGDGGYAHGARAAQIRDALRASDRFAEADLLEIQFDDRGLVLTRWQRLLLQRLQERGADPRLAALVPAVAAWGGRATIESVGYRVVRTFRDQLMASLYGAFAAGPDATGRPARRLSAQADGPVWRLVGERPPALVPPGFANWQAVLDGAIDATVAAIGREAAGKLEDFTWGARNHAGIRSALSPFVPLVGRFTDPPDQPLPGDLYQPRVQAPGFGASERFVVSPGHEQDGYFHMPVGQSDHPLSPYYLAGHRDWVDGRPSPFLPGPAKWRLDLTPAP